MAPVDLDMTPRHATTPATAFSQPKIVGKALELPLVSTTCSSVASLASPLHPYLEGLRTTTVTHILPRIPVAINAYIISAAGMVNYSVAKVDLVVCGAFDTLVERLPALKKEWPELYEDTKETVSDATFKLAGLLASYIICQILLKVIDLGLAVSSSVLQAPGFPAGPYRTRGVEALEEARSAAAALRKEGVRVNGTELVRRMEGAGVLGAVAEAIGLLGLLGLRLKDVEDKEEKQE